MTLATAGLFCYQNSLACLFHPKALIDPRLRSRTSLHPLHRWLILYQALAFLALGESHALYGSTCHLCQCSPHGLTSSSMGPNEEYGLRPHAVCHGSHARLEPHYLILSPLWEAWLRLRLHHRPWNASHHFLGRCVNLSIDVAHLDRDQPHFVTADTLQREETLPTTASMIPDLRVVDNDAHCCSQTQPYIVSNDQRGPCAG